MVARLAGDFYPMDHELAMRPRVRRLFWHLTALVARREGPMGKAHRVPVEVRD